MSSMKPFFIYFVLSISLFVVACSDGTPTPQDEVATVDVTNRESVKENSNLAPSTTEMSKQGLYRVSIRSEVDPLPVNKMHHWTVHVETADGRLVDDARIMVYGGMPEHKHGFPSNPRVTQYLGKGNYKIEGVKFSMPGRWEMWFNVRANGNDDKVIFDFTVP